MFKKISLLLSVLLITLGLVACGDSSDATNADASNETDSNSTENEDNEKQESDEEGNDDEDVVESDFGKLTVAYKNTELEESVESGPFNFSVDGLQVGTLEVNEDYIDMFEGEGKVTVVTMHMVAENTNEDTNGFYPDQSTITTNTGEQIEADMILSDEVGGDFIGEIKKEGDITFLLDSPAEEIEEVNLIVDAPHNEDFEEVGEQIKMTFEIN